MENTAFEFPRLILLGATGSVGEQAVDVALRQKIPVVALSANKNYKRVAELSRLLGVRAAAMADCEAARMLRTELMGTGVKVYGGADGILEMIAETPADFALNAIVGEAGLLPTLSALDAGLHLALANKESLVVAGELVMKKAAGRGLRITPVDSEHSAIFQSLRAGTGKEIKKLILTASGGPFLGKTREELSGVTVRDTLAHPTWQMGAKITVDSATLMNKGFEVIEAAHLFAVKPENIEVLVHRESIVHSMVEFCDNSVIAELSVPDMRLCVQYALTAPVRTEAVIPELDLSKIGSLTFKKPDTETFPTLTLAREMLTRGGGAPAALNAANEVAVSAFLAGKIPFLRIFEILSRVTADLPHAAKAQTLNAIMDIDKEARERAKTML